MAFNIITYIIKHYCLFLPGARSAASERGSQRSRRRRPRRHRCRHRAATTGRSAALLTPPPAGPGPPPAGPAPPPARHVHPSPGLATPRRIATRLATRSQPNLWTACGAQQIEANVLKVTDTLKMRSTFSKGNDQYCRSFRIMPIATPKGRMGVLTY